MQEHTGAADMAETAVNQEVPVSALLDPAVYDHPVERVEKLETHISYVLLAGDYAYKIKKAVDLGFLNFTTLSALNCGFHGGSAENEWFQAEQEINKVLLDAPPRPHKRPSRAATKRTVVAEQTRH